MGNLISLYEEKLDKIHNYSCTSGQIDEILIYNDVSYDIIELFESYNT